MVQLIAAALLGSLPPPWSAQVRGDSVTHPLDALTRSEYEAAVAALRPERYAGAAGLFPLITLQEPAKADVVQWKRGDAVPRRAFAIVMKGPRTFEAVVDLARSSVVSWQEISGVEPGILLTEEWSLAERIVQGHRDWQAAMRKRGITNLGDVVCVPNTVGYYGLPEEQGRRLVKVVCFESSGTKNFWGRPIEGVIAVVDLRASRLVRLIDTGAVPIPDNPVDFDEAAVGELRAPPHRILLQQPEGPSFSIDGHVVSWQKWDFHFRVDPRLGLVVSNVRYDDGRLRSVLYQGSLSELFVSYMDPDAGWFFKTYMDAGEYGVGKLAVELQPELDCPSTAVFFDAVFADEWGDPYPLERSACLFERYAGDIAWRHYEAINGQHEVRTRTELVLRSISAIGNYDYVFDWTFRQDGSIAVAVGVTGVSQVKGVAARTIADDADGGSIAYGRMVAPHTVGVNHDHFFCFRLDLDVDGQQNSFVTERLSPKDLGGASPRKSVWVVEEGAPEGEQAARLRIDLAQPALWQVINPAVLGPVGYPVSYQLKPQANALSLLSPDDMPQRRAGFTDFHLWVTPYDAAERYAAGTYPNQSQGGDGLPRWTAANRPIANRDIVLWYTLGVHHVVRAEDWPVLPTSWSGFELRPFDFFRRNPALDLPK